MHREEEGGKELQSGDDSKVEAGAGQLQDQPILRHSLSPGPDIAHRIRWEDDAVVAMPKGSQCTHVGTLSFSELVSPCAPSIVSDCHGNRRMGRLLGFCPGKQCRLEVDLHRARRNLLGTNWNPLHDEARKARKDLVRSFDLSGYSS